jgi:photosystem II stability/assembly factor-like uncharacterized protein
MLKLARILIAFAVFCFFTFAFLLPLNPPNGTWYQQFFPNLNGRTIIDIEFTDSLTGYAITNTDTPYVLKTINGGDSWTVIFNDNESFTRMAFINSYTGFITRGFVNGTDMIHKTTSGGTNWSTLTMPEVGIANDISVLNADTFWVADPAPLNIGGIYRTTNSGVGWERIYGGTANNPERIYMYNARIGFMYTSQAGPLWKTTNGGYNWFSVTGGVFNDIYFVDSLVGWKCTPNSSGNMFRTIDGGLNWQNQTLPQGGIILISNISRFCVLNRDTIYAGGGQVFYGSGVFRGMFFRSTNGGNNWLFQVPDTSFGIYAFGSTKFLNKNIGWILGYRESVPRLIHTTNGGDTTFLVGLQQISNEIPKKFILFQNYPNPFNPITNIKFQLTKRGSAQLIIYDINGRELIDLVNSSQNAGTYDVDFPGYGYSSGVYFYSLIVDGKRISTKKMILLK